MARVNWDDSVYTNPNYPKLLLMVGCEYKTKGLLLTAWELAQKYWLKHSAVPADKWPDELNVLIEFKFARTETRDSGCFVYVSGSREHCAFLEQKSIAGKKGGKSKSEKKIGNLRQFKNDAKNTEAQPKRHRNDTETTPKRTEASYSYSYSISSSNSLSNSEELREKNFRANDFIAGYSERFKAKYGTNPVIRGKEAGIAKRLAKDFTREKAELYLDAFFAMPDAWLVKTKHPLAALETKLNEVAVFANTGKFTTQAQVRQADNLATTASLLNQIELERKRG